MQLELSVRNIDGLAANFYAADREIAAAMRDAARSAAELVQQVTQQTCAVDTGFMRDHVRIWFTPSGLGFEVGWDADDFFAAGHPFYPFFVEYGTRFMAAQPALEPAYDYVVPIYRDDVSDLIRAAVERRRAA
jgi:HK97 gp10 family phage protein